MASYTECRTCKRWGWENHKCPPTWVAAPENAPDYMLTVYATDAEEAAEEAAKRYDDDGEYYLARGNQMVFLVGRAGGEIIRVSVEGETVPSYRARELGPAIPPATPNVDDGAHDASTKASSGRDHK